VKKTKQLLSKIKRDNKLSILTENKTKQRKKIKWQAFERESPFTLAFNCHAFYRLPENASLGDGDRVGLENCADPGFFSGGRGGGSIYSLIISRSYALFSTSLMICAVHVVK